MQTLYNGLLLILIYKLSKSLSVPAELTHKNCSAPAKYLINFTLYCSFVDFVWCRFSFGLVWRFALFSRHTQHSMTCRAKLDWKNLTLALTFLTQKLVEMEPKLIVVLKCGVTTSNRQMNFLCSSVDIVLGQPKSTQLWLLIILLRTIEDEDPLVY